MNKHYSDDELKTILSQCKMVVDTREQKNSHIYSYLEGKGVEVISRKLNVGDYAMQLGEVSFENDFVVERKANLDEICGNLTADRDRFEREFTRAKANGTKVYLVIENATWGDIYNHNYSSKMTPKALIASLLSWQVRFNVTVMLVSNIHSAELIYGTLLYGVRELLMNSCIGGS